MFSADCIKTYCDIITKKGWGESSRSSFCMVLKLSWHKFKSECYNFRKLNSIPMVTTKKIAIEYTQKGMRSEFKHFTTKNKYQT